MAKKIFTTYRAPVDSYPLGEQNIGLLKPGRYSGFDIMQTGGGLEVIITHSGLIKKTNKNNEPAPNFGAVVFPTGLVLHDEDEIRLVVDTNSGNANIRTDLVIVENTYQEIAGGSPPIYSIVKGSMNGGAEPALPNPAKQILIGRIVIKPNGYIFTDLQYIPERAPLLGDLTYQILNQIIAQAVTIPIATTDNMGIVEQATQSEVNDGDDNERFVTPKGLHNKDATQQVKGLVRLATDSEVIDGNVNNPITAKQFRGNDRKVPLTSSYTLTKDDVGKVFLGMAASTIEIYIPSGLPDNIWFGFISVNCNIKINYSGGGVQVLTITGKLPETKGLNASMLVESAGSNKYIVLGTLKNS